VGFVVCSEVLEGDTGLAVGVDEDFDGHIEHRKVVRFCDVWRWRLRLDWRRWMARRTPRLSVLVLWYDERGDRERTK
jgi:hypothetical protein